MIAENEVGGIHMLLNCWKIVERLHFSGILHRVGVSLAHIKGHVSVVRESICNHRVGGWCRIGVIHRLQRITAPKRMIFHIGQWTWQIHSGEAGAVFKRRLRNSGDVVADLHHRNVWLSFERIIVNPPHLILVAAIIYHSRNVEF